ncbi:deoxyribodipyrimidine photo-lyase [Cytophaga hutchinsonii]|uniref:Deoxyribodipyrimidine photolyase n=1 Tax=Cytophaga hutchinsonii (strain ATCC 33406 / DSM 1761 / CIP 103989 / NBRC 15051 / NCIMB 9469 / D465) TaxID=269798 RepID=A0A6N4SPV7_CYTH3|nr:deoxyribodipyrimidine photo-lyase [Cytophaga hutchinsonii]ABG58332.1 deoxyribodipyrimidine photolyase [Cytophaga hutchinsonii ATCC 33406]
MNKVSVNIVWFKRDLRFTDHEPLYNDRQQNVPVLLVYFFEPSMMTYNNSDTRHSRFVHESFSVPWKMTGDAQRLYSCELGKHYPDLETIRRHAAEKMRGFKRQ